MKRRSFLKFLGIGAAAPVASKVLASPTKLVNADEEIRGLVASVVGVPSAEIITDLADDPLTIRLSEATNVNIEVSNELDMRTLPGVPVPTRLTVTLAGEFLIRRDMFELVASGERIAVLNDDPRLAGALPLQVWALPTHCSIQAYAGHSALTALSLAVVA